MRASRCGRPNPRLQRTPLRAPLSRKPLGHIAKVLALGTFFVIAGTLSIQPCDRMGKVDPEADVRNAELIVVATATKYIREPEGDTRTTGQPESVVGFEVLKVLKGRKVPAVISLHGYLSDRDDFNDHSAPYTLVRPGGRQGSCFANTYKKGSSFLLLLKIRGDEYTTNWDALAPLNEQLHSLDDPWISWVDNQVAVERSWK